MRTSAQLVVTIVLGMLASAAPAVEAYHVTNVWPEAPQGWHFFQLFGVAVDPSDNVYIGDSGNYRIKKFDAEGRFITQWGSPGQGDGQFSEIHGVRVGTSGTVYVVDENNQADTRSRIQMFTAYGQFIGLFERTAPDAKKADLSIDITEDDRGSIFVLAVDYVKKERRVLRTAVEKYSPDREFISQWSMNAGNEDGQLQIPTAIDVDVEGNFYIVEYANNRIQKFDSSGKFLMKWGTSGEGEGRFSRPYSIAIDKSGDIYVRDSYGVHKFTPKGELLAKWKMTGGPRGIALDSHSNVYVTDRGAHAVLKLDNAGKVISEWGIAYGEESRFSEPGSIAVDSSGHLVVADSRRHQIQRLTSEGQFVSRWGGQTWAGVSDVATDASGSLYVACGSADEVQKFNRSGELIGRWGNTGSGDGQFSFASAIAVGPSGNVYVADMSNNRAQKFTNGGEFLTKWGTEGTADGQFSDPVFIATDDSGNVWVGDRPANGMHRMQKFDADGTFLAKWTRKIMTPRAMPLTGAVAVDHSGNSYYAFEDHVEKYDAKGDFVSVYGREKFTEYKLGKVWGMCVDRAGCLYIAGPAAPYDLSTMGNRINASGCIRKYDVDGKLDDTWIAEDAEALPNGPITVDRAGNVYVSYVGGMPIWKLSRDAKPVVKFQMAAPRGGGFIILGGVAVDSADEIYGVDSVDIDWGYGIPSIKKFDADGQFIATWGVPEAGKDKFKYPARIALDGLGNAYVTDQSSHCTHKLDAQGKYIKSWGTKGDGDGQFNIPAGITVNRSGHVYVCDRQNCRIQKFDSDGKFLAKWGKEGSGEGEFHFPAAVVVDRQGFVYVADTNNHRIQKFTADGRFLTEWGEFGEAPGQLNMPSGIAVDDEGNVYVSDSHNHRIQKFAPVPSR